MCGDLKSDREILKNCYWKLNVLDHFSAIAIRTVFHFLKSLILQLKNLNHSVKFYRKGFFLFSSFFKKYSMAVYSKSRSLANFLKVEKTPLQSRVFSIQYMVFHNHRWIFFSFLVNIILKACYNFLLSVDFA